MAIQTPRLPADDPDLGTLTLDELELRWAAFAARAPISAEAMTGADRKAQALGFVPYATVRDLDRMIVNPGHAPNCAGPGQ